MLHEPILSVIPISLSVTPISLSVTPISLSVTPAKAGVQSNSVTSGLDASLRWHDIGAKFFLEENYEIL